jgi:hypothetical protein
MTMKTKLLFVLFFTGQLIIAQNYTFDNSFGVDGKISHANTVTPYKGKVVNGNYYFLSANKLVKVDYNGQMVTGFGTDGSFTIYNPASNETLAISDFIFHNGHFYAYGTIKHTSADDDDIIICKINENGNWDSTWGINGILRIDFGLRESIRNFVGEPDGTLYCTGTRSVPSSLDSRTIYFKVSPDGTLNTGFDATGYKQLMNGAYNYGGKILRYGDDYLLASVLPIADGYANLLLTKIHADGSLDTAYGTNGSKTTPFGGGTGSHSITDVKMYSNRLYVDHYYAFSFNNAGGYMMIYDLATDTKIYDAPWASNGNYNLLNNALYTSTWTTRCGTPGSPAYQCDNTFNVKKRSLDGVIDPTFNGTGSFTYEFLPYEPALFGGDSRALSMIQEDSGKILLAGNVYTYGAAKFSMLRLLPDNLGIADPQQTIPAVYPSPFDDRVTFSTNEPISKIEVYDLTGRMIAQPQFSNATGETVIDLSEIAQSGTYFLKIYAAGKTVIKKIVKK